MTDTFPEFENDDELFPIPDVPVNTDTPDTEEGE